MKRGQPPVVQLEQVQLYLDSTEGRVNILKGLDLSIQGGEAVANTAAQEIIQTAVSD